MKALGRNDTEHNNKIPKESLIKIFQFLAFLLELMQTEKETDHYKNLVQKLPEDFRDEYHRLLQCGFYFIIGMHFAKRGREGKIFNIYVRLITFFGNFVFGFLSLRLRDRTENHTT